MVGGWVVAPKSGKMFILWEDTRAWGYVFVGNPCQARVITRVEILRAIRNDRWA